MVSMRNLLRGLKRWRVLRSEWRRRLLTVITRSWQRKRLNPSGTVTTQASGNLRKRPLKRPQERMVKTAARKAANRLIYKVFRYLTVLADCHKTYLQMTIIILILIFCLRMGVWGKELILRLCQKGCRKGFWCCNTLLCHT